MSATPDDLERVRRVALLERTIHDERVANTEGLRTLKVQRAAALAQLLICLDTPAGHYALRPHPYTSADSICPAILTAARDELKELVQELWPP